MVVTPNPAAMARLQKIHAMAGDLAEHAPDVIAVPEAARSLEQALLGALADCLVTPDGKGSETGSRRRALIMNRFYAVLEVRMAFSKHSTCARRSASRTARSHCCNETLGMGPYRYLKLRQMQLVRRALLRADPRATTVTGIATGHGFWDLGRFAAAYRSGSGSFPPRHCVWAPRQYRSRLTMTISVLLQELRSRVPVLSPMCTAGQREA